MRITERDRLGRLPPGLGERLGKALLPLEH